MKDDFSESCACHVETDRQSTTFRQALQISGFRLFCFVRLFSLCCELFLSGLYCVVLIISVGLV